MAHIAVEQHKPAAQEKALQNLGQQDRWAWPERTPAELLSFFISEMWPKSMMLRKFVKGCRMIPSLKQCWYGSWPVSGLVRADG